MSLSNRKIDLSAIAARSNVAPRRIPTGQRTMSEHDMYRALFGDSSLPLNAIDAHSVVVDHCGREHVRNGLGEWIC